MSAHPRGGDGGDGGAALVVALFAGSLAGGLFLPLSLVYSTVVTDISLPALGLVLTLAGAITLPLPVLAGWLVDRFGPRAFVVSAQALQAAAYLGFVVAREPFHVFVASATMALGSRLYWSTIFALVADHVETRAGRGIESWFATVNTTRTVGIVCGGLLSGVVVSTDDPDAYRALAGAASACAALSALTLLRVGAPGRALAAPGGATDHRALIRNRSFVSLLGINTIFALSTLSLGLMLPTLVRSGLHGPGWLTSALLVANAALVAILGQRGGRLAGRFGPLPVLRAAGSVWALAFLVLALGAVATLDAAVPLLLAAVTVLSVGEVLHAPASTSMVTALTAPAERGRYLAVFQYSFVAAELVGPVLFTSLFGLSHALPFLALAALDLAALPALAALRQPFAGSSDASGRGLRRRGGHRARPDR